MEGNVKIELGIKFMMQNQGSKPRVKTIEYTETSILDAEALC